MTPVEHIVLRLLKEAAEAGRICPTNAELALAAGVKSLSGPARAMQMLEVDGHIIVQRFTASRIVTILDTGHATADPFTVGARATAHHRDGRPADAPRAITRCAQSAPCSFCGVNPAHGCDCRPRAQGLTVLRGRIPQEIRA